MMIVSDGRYANPAPCERVTRMMDFISDSFSGQAHLIAASAATIARRFPGAIFRPASIQDGISIPGALNRVEAINALITIASALPDDVDEIDVGRGSISFSISRSVMSGVVLQNADAVSRRLSPEKTAILVNGLTDRGGSYCVMGDRPETEAIPRAVERILAALGPERIEENIDLCIISHDGDRVECMEVSMILDLTSEHALEMSF